MKKNLLILALIAGLSYVGSAQTNSAGKTHSQQKAKLTPSEKAEKLTKYMTTELGLTADQQQKVSQLNASKAQQISDVKAKYNGDMKAAQAELKPIKQEYNSNLKTILTPEQYTKWEEIKKQKREDIKQKRQNQDAVSPEDVE